jgi:hypothetical protein
MTYLKSAGLVLLGASLACSLFWAVPGGVYGEIGSAWATITTASETRGDKPASNEKRTKGLILLAQQSVEKSLFDPYSAVFDDLRVVTGDTKHSVAVCGTVNAKNRMGAYVGRTAFLYESLTDSAMIYTNDHGNSAADYFRSQIGTRCNGGGTVDPVSIP